MTPYTKKKPFSGLTPYGILTANVFLLMENGFYLLQETGGKIIAGEKNIYNILTPYNKQEQYQLQEKHNKFNPYQATNNFTRKNPYGQKDITT